MPKAAETVDQFMARLDHPLKTEIEAIRALILQANPSITEQVKWNAPSFCHAGEDRVTLHLRAKEGVMLVFHRGTKNKDTTGFAFDDPTGLMKWAAPDRALVTLRDMADVEARKTELADLVRRWVEI